jgi:hypothetical protein
LGKSDVQFSVKEDGATFGTLTISNGSIVWFPEGTTYGHRMRWMKFDKLIKENATNEEARSRILFAEGGGSPGVQPGKRRVARRP